MARWPSPVQPFFSRWGAVGRVTHQVREVGLVGGVPKFVHQVVRRLDMPHGSHVAVHGIGRQVLRRQLYRPVGNYLDIAEALVVEPGHELVVAAAQGHHVGLEQVVLVRRTEIDVDVRQVGMAVFAQAFGMDEPQLRPGFTPQAELRHTGHVLAEIVEVAPFVELAHAARPVFGDIADRHRLLCRDPLRRRAAVHHPAPGRVVEPGGAPARLFEPRVVMLRSIDAVEHQRPARGAPVEVGLHDLVRPVRILDTQVEAERRAVAPRRPLEVPHGARLVVVPAVAQQDAHGIGPVLQLPRHVIGDVEVPAVEARIHRVEAVVADLPPVDMEFVQPGRRDIGAGRFHAFAHGELLAEIGRGLMVYVVVVADPASLPVFDAHHAGLERCDPGRGARVVLVPDRHGPVIPGERVEFRPGVTDEHPVRIRAPRIPHVAASGGHGGGIPPHDDPVSPLECPGTAVVQTPAQSRRRGVDAQRRLQMFAPQPHGRTRCRGLRTQRGSRKTKR